MVGILNIVIVLALAATVLVLGVGLFSMAKGGAFDARHANRLMRLRVLAQGIAVVLVAVAMLLLAYERMGGG